MVVWYSLVGSNGKATPDDVMDPAIKPRAGEWYRQSGPDKFLGSTLEPTLRQAGIKTVIVCGNSFQGATVGTARARRSAATKSSFQWTARPARTSITNNTPRFISPRAAPSLSPATYADAQHDDQILI